MQPQKAIIDCYDKTAKNYADKFIDELDKKHLDRILLQSFAAANSSKGKLIDLGCGPGQTTRFLYNAGVKDIIGIDISPNMITEAQTANPSIHFEVSDMLALKLADNSAGSAIAFYSIVNFDYERVKAAFKEIKRVLVDDGELLFSFHVGKDTVHLDNFLDQQVDIDFYFFDIDNIAGMLTDTGFEIVDIIERQPYKDIEYPSKRAYIWVRSKV
jgi:ubiquinone/menaquinone biosynthesis C-methylase UbiE